jgi:hypothetical protein
MIATVFGKNQLLQATIQFVRTLVSNGIQIERKMVFWGSNYLLYLIYNKHWSSRLEYLRILSFGNSLLVYC